MTEREEFKERKGEISSAQIRPLVPLSRGQERGGGGALALAWAAFTCERGLAHTGTTPPNNGAVMRLPFFRDNRWGPFRERGCCSLPIPTHHGALYRLKGQSPSYLRFGHLSLSLSPLSFAFSRRRPNVRRLAAPPKSD